MNIESEKKIILSKIPSNKDGVSYYDILNIKQFYVYNYNSELLYRLRISLSSNTNEITCYKTIKKKIDVDSNYAVYEEYNDVIDIDTLKRLLFDANMFNYVEKNRYNILDLDTNNLWEIDHFLNHNLIVAELEVEDYEKDVDLPFFIKKFYVDDVSTDKKYKNEYLSKDVIIFKDDNTFFKQLLFNLK